MENEEYLLSEDITLDNESILKKEWIYKNKINLCYAPNGTCKTLICKKLFKKFDTKDSEYVTFKYSYFEKLEEGINLENYIDNLKIKSNLKDIISINKNLICELDIITKKLPILKENYEKFLFMENDLSFYKNKEKSLLETFFTLLHELNEFLKNQNIDISIFLNICEKWWNYAPFNQTNNSIMMKISKINLNQNELQEKINEEKEEIFLKINKSQEEIDKLKNLQNNIDDSKIHENYKEKGINTFKELINAENNQLSIKINESLKNLTNFFIANMGNYFLNFYNEIKIKFENYNNWETQIKIFETISKFINFIYVYLSIKKN